MAANVTAIMNGTQPPSCFNPTAEIIGETFALLPVICYFAYWKYHHWDNCLQEENPLRKPINFFIVNMAMSDLLFPIFLFPRIVTHFYLDSWLISGPLGQALCKLLPFLSRCLRYCVCSEPGSDSRGSIWSCGIPPPFPIHQFKTLPLLHSRHLDHRNGFPLPTPDRRQTCRVSGRAGMCVAVERSIWRLLVFRKLRCGNFRCIPFYPFGFDCHTLPHHCFKN